MSKGFYAALPAMQNYTQLVEAEHYFDLPADWVLLLTDVKGSTKAIESGRYKEVNMVGVSSIISVQNALEGVEFPFIFGGDGATLAVPGEYAEVAKQALSHTRLVAREQFDLELRIAVIPAGEILKTGAPLKVAKLQITDGHKLALIRGAGWATAENWMKDGSASFNLSESFSSEGHHEGLECRWNPLKARKHEVMALIVQAQAPGEDGQKIYREILNEILSGDSKPVSVENLKPAWPPRYLPQEAKVRVRKLGSRMIYLLKNYVFLFLIAVVLWARGKRNVSEPIPYMSELTQNTDYLKFDECLRMIIDVSAEQKRTLLSRLDRYYREGKIYYGAHCDPYALMTCYIQGPHKHFHFVDAGGGGYAIAAKQLKAQKRS